MTELITLEAIQLERIQPIEVFTNGGLEPLLAKVEAEAQKKALEEKLANEAALAAQRKVEAEKYAYPKGSYEEIIFNWGSNHGYTLVTSEIMDLIDMLGLKQIKAA